jgi:K+-transporting ATPase KdpF subunit
MVLPPKAPAVYAFFMAGAKSSSPFLRIAAQTCLIGKSMEESDDGHRLRCAARGPLGPDGAAGQSFQAPGKPTGRPAMIPLDAVYGLVGMCSVLLLAYLVYALIRAEDF